MKREGKGESKIVRETDEGVENLDESSLVHPLSLELSKFLCEGECLN